MSMGGVNYIKHENSRKKVWDLQQKTQSQPYGKQNIIQIGNVHNSNRQEMKNKYRFFIQIGQNRHEKKE